MHSLSGKVSCPMKDLNSETVVFFSVPHASVLSSGFGINISCGACANQWLTL